MSRGFLSRNRFAVCGALYSITAAVAGVYLTSASWWVGLAFGVAGYSCGRKDAAP